MSTYHYIHVKTNVKNLKKGQSYYYFKACANAREVMRVDRMAGKIKDYILSNVVETITYGDSFNGYGYESHYYRYLLTPTKVKELQAIIEGKKAESKPPKTEEEIIEAWSKRLAKLGRITLDEAKDIALEKLNAKTDQVNALIGRQAERASIRRSRLISKIIRSNPLRYIKDEQHAMNILAASYRHRHTDYDDRLEEYREQAAWGEIDYEEVKARAREDVAEDVRSYMDKKMAGME